MENLNDSSGAPVGDGSGVPIRGTEDARLGMRMRMMRRAVGEVSSGKPCQLTASSRVVRFSANGGGSDGVFSG